MKPKERLKAIAPQDMTGWVETKLDKEVRKTMPGARGFEHQARRLAVLSDLGIHRKRREMLFLLRVSYVGRRERIRLPNEQEKTWTLAQFGVTEHAEQERAPGAACADFIGPAVKGPLTVGEIVQMIPGLAPPKPEDGSLRSELVGPVTEILTDGAPIKNIDVLGAKEPLRAAVARGIRMIEDGDVAGPPPHVMHATELVGEDIAVHLGVKWAPVDGVQRIGEQWEIHVHRAR